MGQPELKRKLALPRLEQFRQRVVFHYHLDPMTREESKEYIKHRLKKAGNEYANIFTDDAIEEIYKHSNGVPRLINLICHNALISGLVHEARQIDSSIVREAIKESILGYTQDAIYTTQDEPKGAPIWDELLKH